MCVTFDETVKNHKELWQWMAENTKGKYGCSDKDDYFYSKGIVEKSEMPLYECFCCEYTQQFSDPDSFVKLNCSKCPVIWGTEEKNKRNFCMCEILGSPYKGWLDACGDEDIEKARQFALEILNLPIREKTEEDF